MSQVISNNPNASRGRQPGEQKLVADFYAYNILFTTLNAGTSQTANIQIQADSDFEIQKLTAFATTANSSAPSTTTMPLVTVLLTDTGSGRQLTDIAVPISSLFGTAQLPFILPNTKILQARAVLAIQISNFGSGVNYSTIQLSFIGRKLFRGFQ